MKKLSLILFILSLGLDVNGQIIPVKRDTTRRLGEVKVEAIIKRKIESDMKMAVSVDEFLASSESISFIKRGGLCMGTLTE
jgi:iron complex outermembrane receptor protein